VHLPFASDSSLSPAAVFRLESARFTKPVQGRDSIALHIISRELIQLSEIRTMMTELRFEEIPSVTSEEYLPGH
jgi:hypothetical protein